MTVGTHIQDGGGSDNNAFVEDRGLLTSQIMFPPMVEQKTRITRQYVTNDGSITGSHDLLVNGSTTPQDFWVAADSDEDRYITFLNFVIAYPSTSALFAEWADDNAPLTNGVTVFYSAKGIFAEMQDPMTVNGELMRLSTNPSLVETRSILAVNDYGFISVVDLTKYMPPYGVKLERGSNYRFGVRIQDDLTASNTTLFNCFTYGFFRFE